MENIKAIVPINENIDDQFQEKFEEINLEEFAKQAFENIESEDSVEESRRFKKWQKNRSFYRGNQRGFWDSKKRTWVTVDLDSLSPSEASVLVVNNQFRPQIKTLAKEFSRSQTRIRANSRSDSQQSILASRFSDALIRYYQPKLLPETKRQREAKFMFLCGGSFRYTRYNKSKPSSKVKSPIMGSSTLPEYTSSVCLECGYKHEGALDLCPDCNALMETTKVDARTLEDVVVGYNKINSGDLETEIVDPSEIKVWAGAVGGILDTPYLRRRRFVKAEFIKEVFPYYEPQNNVAMSESAQAQWQFKDTTTSIEAAVNKGILEYNQLWLDYAYYCDKKLKEDATFKKKVGDKWVTVRLPKGLILKEVFPDGMYICKVGDDILGYYPENKNKKWLYTAYDLNVDGFWGDGLEDSVMNQQIINEYTSLSVENVLYNASPKLVINPSLINPVSVTGRPADMILMSDNARTQNEPKQAFAQIAGMSLTREVMEGVNSAKQDMREQTGALLGFNGQGDPNITTATGMSIARDSALALVSTPLAIRAETDELHGWQILRLIKENWIDEKYKFLLGKYNEEEAEAFKESDLDEQVSIYVEPNSWMPLTNYEKVQNLGAYLTAFGLPLGFLNPQIPEPVRTYAAQLYNIPFDFDELAPDIRIAQKRLDIAKDLASQQIPIATKAMELAARAGKPEEGADIAMKVSIIISDAMGVEEDLDDHQIFILENTKWLKTDEGQNAHPILRQAVKFNTADHRAFLEAAQAEEAKRQMIMNGGQPPQPEVNNGQWQPTEAEDSPFSAPPSKVQDFSENANASNL